MNKIKNNTLFYCIEKCGKVVSVEGNRCKSCAKKGNKNPSKRPEVRKKLSNSHKGKIPWNKNIKGYSTSLKGRKKEPRSEKIKEQISLTCKRNGVGKWMIGRKLSEETKRKIGLNGFHYGMKGKHQTKEAKEKISKASRGRILSMETREKIRLANLGEKSHFYNKRLFKENNPNWKNGKSFEPYPLEWTETLRESIRFRDKYKCQICGCSRVENGKQLDVHHIDYNKDNLDLNNLIALCVFCHGKTNKNRKYWENFFRNKNNEMFKM